MAMLDAMNISATGMTAERLRTDIISQNIANVNTTRDANGNTYKRKIVVMQEKDVINFSDVLRKAAGNIGDGVKIASISEDQVTPMKMVYDPSHPDANEDGYVEYPNVNVVTEMTDLIDASRAYEANVTAFNGIKNMMLKALEIGK